jgi:AcrR family transcriptional regulator
VTSYDGSQEGVRRVRAAGEGPRQAARRRAGGPRPVRAGRVPADDDRGHRRRAGVSAESVYKGFGTKAALAKEVFDLALAGDDDPVPVAERPATLAVRDEPDVRRKIALFAAGLAQRQARSALVTILIRDGRHVDDSLAPVWAKLREEGLTGMTALGRHLVGTGQLRPGLDLAEVRDVLWNYLAIDHYERLVLSQGWPLERYERWLAEAITSALCP